MSSLLEGIGVLDLTLPQSANIISDHFSVNKISKYLPEVELQKHIYMLDDRNEFTILYNGEEELSQDNFYKEATLIGDLTAKKPVLEAPSRTESNSQNLESDKNSLPPDVLVNFSEISGLVLVVLLHLSEARVHKLERITSNIKVKHCVNT
ncbi:hypothetical protein CONCODRAFT_7989 [Conidiobolus coronatus NRRL 28638]|uniref:Uncharacterized protein n=1 Tax=Conidiobolus coronatus (strain ATCC 28846 / CBS 209.66 / NRRL 28638) TaxID=796925 RepID=A0A137P3H5_CONC2|nr:hypothetical protein CONCODRAFT_7989 [Conidiobolus coronatus NRRL 28638]|eukprot:KXN69576.1 hypothetical protein CONCODRAFT_7989 [Conidiobolus coronatus NRRL 28638]